MLHSEPPQKARLHATFTGSYGDEAGVGELVTFALGFLRRYYISIMATTMLALVLCMVYLSVTPPTYTAQARVLLENRKAQFVQEQSLLAEQIFNMSQIETQLEIIKSRSIALAVIKRLNLADDPDINGSAISFWERIRAPFSQSPKQPRSAAVEQPSEAMIGAFLDRLQASRLGTSNIVEIGFNSSSAGRSAMIANAVADTYIKDQVNAKAESSRNATAWLQDRLGDLSNQALVAERAVTDYKAEHNIVSSGGNRIDEQQVTDLNMRLVASRARTSDVLAQLNRYKSVLHADAEGSPTVEALVATGSDALNNPIINNLRQQYLEVGRRKSEYSERFGRNHLAVIDLQRRMQNLRASMLGEVRRLAETIQSDYLVAKQQQQEIEKQLDAAVSLSRTTNSDEVALGELEGRAKTYRSLHDTLLHRYMGAVQQETFPISEVRLISPALPPEGKTKPKTMLILALGTFGGIAVGIAAGLFRHLTDRAFRTSDHVEAALHLCCLSMVPRLRAANLPKVLPAVAQQTDADFSREKIGVNPVVGHLVDNRYAVITLYRVDPGDQARSRSEPKQ